MIRHIVRLLLTTTLAFTLTLGISEKALAQPVERIPVLIGLENNLGLDKKDIIERDIVARGGSVTHKYRIVDAFAAQL